MVRTGKILFIVLSLLLILMLALAGILSPSWLFSPVYIVVYLLYALSSLLAAVLAPGFLRKTLHLLLALLIAGVVAEKSFNERRMIPMGEGGPYRILTPGDTLDVTLLDFTMTRRGPEGAVEYESRLSVDSEDTVSVRVNRPFSRGQMRLYQSEHRLLTPYHICLEGDTLKLFAGQNGTLRGACLCFQGYDPGRERAEIRYNEVPFYLPVEKKQRFMEQDLYIYAGEPEIGTVLEYVEVRGHRILLIIAAMILLTLVYAVVKRK